MRNLIIGAAALLAVAVPGVAAAQTGYVDLGYASTNVDQTGGDIDIDTWAVGGVVAFDANELGVQLDGRFANSEIDSGGGDIDSWGVGAHLYKRQGNWLIGGYAGFGNVDISGADSDEWTVALETQYYMSRTTIDGSLSFSDAEDLDIETTALDLGVTHFVHDNFSIGAGIGFSNVETTGGDLDGIAFGVGAEYQFASYPVSIFGGYQHNEIDDANLEADTLSVGIRYNWGGTLFDRNRSGASLGRRTGGVSRLFGGSL